MIQDERWQSNYDEVMKFLKTNNRNLSNFNLEERRLYTWLKHNRKQMNADALKEPRLSKFVSIQPLFRRSQIDSVPFLRPSEQAAKLSGAEFLTLGVMVVKGKDIEALWIRYQSEDLL